MRKKLLVIVGTLGICAMAGLEPPVYAYEFCDTYCPTQTTRTLCQCPLGTAAFQNGGLALCTHWRVTCNYL